VRGWGFLFPSFITPYPFTAEFPWRFTFLLLGLTLSYLDLFPPLMVLARYSLIDAIAETL